MKRGIHPVKKRILVITTDGCFFDINIAATYNKSIMKLDLDTKKHPAWNTMRTLRVVESGNRLQRFKSKYS